MGAIGVAVHLAGWWGIRGRQGSSCTLYRTLCSGQLAHVGRRSSRYAGRPRVHQGIVCAGRTVEAQVAGLGTRLTGGRYCDGGDVAEKCRSGRTGIARVRRLCVGEVWRTSRDGPRWLGGGPPLPIVIAWSQGRSFLSIHQAPPPQHNPPYCISRPSQ